MGQEDQELLIRGGSKHPSAEHLNNGDSGAASQSCINQGFGQAKNYGTLRPPSPPEDSGSGSGQVAENLTYAWHNMDIFGAVNQPGSGWRQLELSLSKCQHTIIGVPGRVKGLSEREKGSVWHSHPRL
ncbi:GM18853 [Drosophila sechellia]|uniref:GM18853 n=1 Tax=Drosophila sechellia TaxID=7238 RepID=B4IA03_DROSE|nr:GM18853 [Drosophila sechellia]